MAQMEVIVNRLNRRRSPVIDFNDKSNVVDVVAKGATFESVGEIENVLGKWHRDGDGFYYSEVGLSNRSLSGLTNLPGAPVPISGPNASWMNALGIGQVWNITKGNLANIAVLDTGINLANDEIRSNLFSKDPDKCCRNFLDNTSDVSDQFGHGSHCAALISSRNREIDIAMAPESKLFIGKISAFGELRGYEMLTKGLNWASSIPEVDVISISFGLSEDHPSFKDFSDAVNVAASKNKIIVAAIGDKDVNPNPVYPALFSSCISVGACDASFVEWDGNVDYDRTFLYAPGSDITSYVVVNDFFPVDPFLLSGSSQATAVVAGIVALMISCFRKKNKKYNLALIKKILAENSRPLVSGKSRIAIDPVKIFSKI